MKMPFGGMVLGVLVGFFPALLEGLEPVPVSGRPLRQIQENSPDFPQPLFPLEPAKESLASSFLDQPLVRQYITRYSNPAGLAWLNSVMSRGGPYLAFIREELRKQGLPPELIYLPVIESNYLPTAVSRSGATGLWQFMQNSIAPFDMKVTEWVDERMDFWKSTVGALRKLEENYRHFGDWPLALAAYNAGTGGVNQVIRNSGIRDYWVLSEKKLLKTETIHYVPKLLAVSHILSHPREYGLDLLWQEDPRWVRVPVNRMADLELLAAATGIKTEVLKQANPELRFGVTPPDGGYMLKARAADAAVLSLVLEQRDLSLVKYYFHTIRSGDTLSVLGLHYGVSAAQIIAANPGLEAQRLQIGARIRIPAIKETGPFKELARAGQNLPFEGTYQVQRGDTLWSIALAHHVDPEVLAGANGMGINDILREGRVLKTPIIRTEE